MSYRSLLHTIISSYILLGGILYTVLLLYWGSIHLYFDLTQIITFCSYAFVLYECYRMPDSFFTASKLLSIVSVYSFVFLLIYFNLSDYYTGDTFMFGPPDPQQYYRVGSILSKIPFDHFYPYLKSIGYKYDDMGAPVMFGAILKLLASKFTVDVIFVLIGSISSLALFDIGSHLMQKKYSFMASLSFSIASYSIFFYGSFLKETGMLFIIISSFWLFYKFVMTNRLLFLVSAVTVSLIIVYFRPVILSFLWLAFLSYYLMDKKNNSRTIILFFIFGVLFSLIYSYMSEAVDSYTKHGNLESTQNYIGATSFSIMTSVIGVLVGPFPQMLCTRRILYYVPFYGAGLLFKFLLFYPFWKGFILCIKSRTKAVMPIFAFCIIEMIALAIVNDGIELRKALPHIPFFFLSTFWFISEFDEGTSKEIRPSAYYLRTCHMYHRCVIIVFFLTFAWNSLR